MGRWVIGLVNGRMNGRMNGWMDRWTERDELIDVLKKYIYLILKPRNKEGYLALREEGWRKNIYIKVN